MKTIVLTPKLILLSVFASAITTASPARTGAISVPANDIVGLWSTQAMVGPCGGPQPVQILNTLLFHAGGTVVDIPRFPPAGNAGYQRTLALGTWTYDAAINVYSIHLRFENFVNGVYEGYSTVDREIQISDDGEEASGPVTANRFLENGTLLSAFCGFATSTRL